MKTASTLTIVPASPTDRTAITALLQAADLPHDDLPPHLAHFLVARCGGQVIGAVGAEISAPDALLRSLVVAPEHRGAGIGGRLVDALEVAAGQWGVATWWLLTTTAQTFFARRGFSVVVRSSAPPTIQRTGQFSGGCCCSAVCMTRERRAAT